MARSKRDLSGTGVQGRRDPAERDQAVSRRRKPGDGTVRTVPDHRSRDTEMRGRDTAAAARELVRRARKRQGLPAKINDPAVISRIVALLQPSDD